MNIFIATTQPNAHRDLHGFKGFSQPSHDCVHPVSKEEVKHHWKACRVPPVELGMTSNDYIQKVFRQ